MGKRKSNKGEAQLLEGVLDLTRSGMGYVIVKGRDQDIIVKPNDLNKAFDGDVVRISMKDIVSGKRPEGVVREVVKRKQIQFVGELELSESFAFFTPSGDTHVPDFYISRDNINGAKDKDKVVVEFLKWEKGEKKPEGRVVSVLNATNAADMAMKEIVIENGFSLDFPAEVIDESKVLKEPNTGKATPGRRDYRDVLTFTIDPADAKDFDDALSVKELNDHEYEIGVHIADVSHFVTPDSALDKEAYQRSTSVYLPDRVIPMLPEKISNELCSLRPNEDKYCFSAVFKIDSNAKVKDSWFGKTLIHSDHRFTYEEAQEIIEKKNGKFSNELLLVDGLAKKYRKERFQKGAINFSSVEVKFQLDASGNPIGIMLKESKDAHQMIEEFMLLANRSVAAYAQQFKIHKKPIPFPYRIHDDPDEEKLKPFVAFAKKFGYSFSMKNEKEVALSFNRLLEAVKGKPEQHVLEQLGIRTMAKAAYSPENIGHYGLGFENYCHFTSPIRRYPDIMVHRILQELLAGNVYEDKKMEQKCTHCSERERAAMEAERAGNKYKQVQFMKDRVGEEMDGIISGVSSFGFWVETVNEKCEGLVSVKDLSEYDDFKHDEANYTLVGARTGKAFRMGDQVHVLLVAANLDKRQLDFEWAPPEGKRKTASAGKQHGKPVKEKKKTHKRSR